MMLFFIMELSKKSGSSAVQISHQLHNQKMTVSIPQEQYNLKPNKNMEINRENRLSLNIKFSRKTYEIKCFILLEKLDIIPRNLELCNKNILISYSFSSFLVRIN